MLQAKSRDSVQSVSAMLDDPDCSKEVRRCLALVKMRSSRRRAWLWQLGARLAGCPWLPTSHPNPNRRPGPQASVEQRCSEAFAAVRHFEKTHCLALQNMGYTYLQRRSELVAKCFDVAAR